MKKTNRSFSALCVTLTLLAFAASAGAQNPTPLVNQPLVPTVAAAGGPAFTLTVNGTGFASGSTVQWKGAALTTQFVSASQLTATVPASDIAASGTASVTVSSPAPGGGVSNAEFLSITSARLNIGLAAFSTVSGCSASSVTVADFNGDGKPDLVVTGGSDGVCVALGNGDGTFQSPKSYTTGADPYFVIAADFNHDGKMDLAVTNTGANTVSVLLGNGDGTFQPRVDYGVGPLGNTQMSLAADDFNGDGNLDLVTANADGSISALLGNGDGTFQPQLTQLVFGTGSLAVGDFNGDGKLDLAVSGGGVGIWLGNGDGTFTDFFTFRAIHAAAIVTTDLNGDAKLDLAFIGEPGIYVALGNGDGTFQNAVAYATGGGPVGLAVADFNGDGKLDLVTGGESTLSTLLGNGDGTFQSHIDQSSSSIVSSSAADFNGDGIMDLVSAPYVTAWLGTTAIFSSYSLNFGSQNVGTTSSPQTLTLTNAGGGTLTISSIMISGDFAQTDNCGSSLAPGASCTFNVTFTPTAYGTRIGSITVTDSALGSPQFISLSGVGNAPAVQLAPAALVFSDQKVGTQSKAQNVTLTDTGNLTLSITSISTSVEFGELNGCGNSVASGASCTISVSFKPLVQGTKTGTLTVSDNAPGSPQTVKLTGTGIVFELSATFVNLGNVVIGQTSSQNLTLTNSANTAQKVNLGIGHNNSGEFSQTNNCGTSIPANSSCTITLTFTSKFLGPASANLEVVGGGATQTVPLSGTGTH